MKFQIPEALAEEHRELHGTLAAAPEEPGDVGTASRAVVGKHVALRLNQ